MKKQLLIILMATILLATVFAGCTTSTNTTTTSSSTSTQATKELRIGALLPLSGEATETGRSAQAALAVASDDINTYLVTINSDTRIRFVPLDTRTDPATALDDLKALHAQGIPTRRGVMASHVEPPYRDAAPHLPHTERAAEECLLLPIHPALGDAGVEAVLSAIDRAFAAA